MMCARDQRPEFLKPYTYVDYRAFSQIRLNKFRTIKSSYKRDIAK